MPHVGLPAASRKGRAHGKTHAMLLLSHSLLQHACTCRGKIISPSPLPPFPAPPLPACLLQSYLDYFKNLTSDISVVQGDFDEFPSPENTVRRVTKGAG